MLCCYQFFRKLTFLIMLLQIPQTIIKLIDGYEKNYTIDPSFFTFLV